MNDIFWQQRQHIIPEEVKELRKLSKDLQELGQQLREGANQLSRVVSSIEDGYDNKL